MSDWSMFEPYQINTVVTYSLGEKGECRLCAANIELVEFPYQVHGVCGRCAGWIANHFNMRHGGEWLTWPNPVREPTAKELARKSLSRALRQKIFERDRYRCIACGDHRNLECDHIVPLADGGTNDASNLQTLCKTCNASKGTKSMNEWRP